MVPSMSGQTLPRLQGVCRGWPGLGAVDIGYYGNCPECLGAFQGSETHISGRAQGHFVPGLLRQGDSSGPAVAGILLGLRGSPLVGG